MCACDSCVHVRVYECMHVLVYVWGVPALTVLSTFLLGLSPLPHARGDVNLVHINPEADTASIVLKGTFCGPSHFFLLIVCELNSLSLSFPSCDMGQDSSSEGTMRDSLVRWCLVFRPLCPVDIETVRRRGHCSPTL